MSAEGIRPRARVIVDNDFAGDPDDLFQLAHHLLCPSVEIRGVVASHLRPGDPFDPEGNTAADAARRARELLAIMGMEGRVPVFEGARSALSDSRAPIESEGARAIVAEAMRDSDLPLFICCGGGLTDLASALMMEGRVAERATVVWIGGPEYPGLGAPPPAAPRPEYNLAIDASAAMRVFGESAVPLWQVPRDAYRQVLVSLDELERAAAEWGRLGAFLMDALRSVPGIFSRLGMELGETYILGDEPLVLLTALTSPFDGDASSSEYVLRERPTIEPDGSYGRPAGRGRVRVYARVDARLVLGDLFAKLRRFAAARG
jgi:purine nucleosidase